MSRARRAATQHLAAAFTSGLMAHRAGGLLRDNPYRRDFWRDRVLAARWERGFMESREATLPTDESKEV